MLVQFNVIMVIMLSQDLHLVLNAPLAINVQLKLIHQHNVHQVITL